jgi:hypothetical protein
MMKSCIYYYSIFIQSQETGLKTRGKQRSLQGKTITMTHLLSNSAIV